MDIVCFYIISYTIINCITTVYRSYGADIAVVVVRVVVRVEHVIAVNVAAVHIAQAEVAIRITRIRINIA